MSLISTQWLLSHSTTTPKPCYSTSTNTNFNLTPWSIIIIIIHQTDSFIHSFIPTLSFFHFTLIPTHSHSLHFTPISIHPIMSLISRQWQQLSIPPTTTANLYHYYSHHSYSHSLTFTLILSLSFSFSLASLLSFTLILSYSYSHSLTLTFTFALTLTLTFTRSLPLSLSLSHSHSHFHSHSHIHRRYLFSYALQFSVVLFSLYPGSTNVSNYLRMRSKRTRVSQSRSCFVRFG